MKRNKLIISMAILLAILMLFSACDTENSSAPLQSSTSITTTPSPSLNPDMQQYKSMDYTYFDTVTTIQGYANSGEEFGEITKDIYALLAEYHKLFDIYNSYSGINNLRTINKLYNGEHKVITVDQKIIDMLLYAKEMYNKTNGEINIAMGSVLSIWHDYRSEADNNWGIGQLPPMEELQEAAKHTNINDVIIDDVNNTVYLADPKMKLDVGAIAKGYAVEMIARMLEDRGITGFVINVGGNIRTIGIKANGKTWGAGITNPFDDEENPYVAYIGLSGQTIVTSGSYQRYYIVDGKPYHHIIDKDTLMPAVGFESVSIVCGNSAMGDGLSTAVFCMSLEEGRALIESLDGVEALWVLSDGTLVRSSGFSYYENQYKK